MSRTTASSWSRNRSSPWRPSVRRRSRPSGSGPDQIRDIVLADDVAPVTSHYIRKMTGLDHKPIGTMKVHFTFEGMPLVTFEGNASVASSLIPENAFVQEIGRGPRRDRRHQHGPAEPWAHRHTSGDRATSSARPARRITGPTCPGSSSLT